MQFLTDIARRYAPVAIILALVAASAPAADPLPPRTGIDWLDWATAQVSFVLQEAAPPETPVVEARPLPPADPLEATHSIETIEIHRLQQEIHHLRKLIEREFVDRIVALESELREVKVALQRRAGQEGTARSTGPIVPRPDDRRVLPDPAEPRRGIEELRAMAAGDPAPTPKEPAGPPEEFTFTVVDEWGRSPEVVAEMGGEASTLIGIAGVVPPGSTRDDVVALARALRADYDAYENINIEIFDAPAAARAFAERQVVDSERHVVSISRHTSSGRDLIVYLGGAKPEEVPPVAKEAVGG